MTPHKQRFRHRPAEGVFGDCHRTAIACILDVEPEEVPHEHHADSDRHLARVNDWLRPRGLQLLNIAFDSDPPKVLAAMKSSSPGVTFMLCGMSRTGVDHVVVARDGEIIHDPAQNDSGIIGRGSDGHTWVTALVRV